LASVSDKNIPCLVTYTESHFQQLIATKLWVPLEFFICSPGINIPATLFRSEWPQGEENILVSSAHPGRCECWEKMAQNCQCFVKIDAPCAPDLSDLASILKKYKTSIECQEVFETGCTVNGKEFSAAVTWDISSRRETNWINLCKDYAYSRTHHDWPKAEVRRAFSSFENKESGITFEKYARQLYDDKVR